MRKISQIDKTTFRAVPAPEHSK